MRQLIPVTNQNQVMEITLTIDNVPRTLGFVVQWNRTAAYWTMKVYDPATAEIILDSIPLVRGMYDSANIIQQYRYLKIGAAYLMRIGQPQGDNPTYDNFGTDFLLMWGDTPVDE